ncbi:MAG: hypothetical protein J6C00_06000 [Eubacterium sp.]|nr:hypothetical protein [Eubacterium sp.]
MDNFQNTTTAPAISADAPQPAPQTPEPQPAAQADKAARFINRAENQTSKVIAELEKLQKLSNKKYYTYSPDQVDELFAAIQSALDETKATFTSDNVEKKKLFTFSA